MNGDRQTMPDAKAATPLYLQIREILEQRIAYGELEAGDRLPSESELAKQFGVSIITIRNAVADLCKRGLLEKKQGKGTFVKKSKVLRNGSALYSFSQDCLSQGIVPGGRMLENSLIRMDRKTAAKLGQKPGSQGVLIERLRYADGKPVVIERCVFPLQYAYLLGERFDDNSLFAFLKEKGQVVLTRSDKEIELCRATKKEGELLEVPEGTVLMLVKSVAYVNGSEPVYVGRQVMNGERFTLRLSQGPGL